MELHEAVHLINYLASKKVSFAVKQNVETGLPEKIIGITLTKEGKFFRANGKIIARNMAELLM